MAVYAARRITSEVAEFVSRVQIHRYMLCCGFIWLLWSRIHCRCLGDDPSYRGIAHHRRLGTDSAHAIFEQIERVALNSALFAAQNSSFLRYFRKKNIFW